MTKEGGEPNKGGSRVLAFFDFDAPTIGMKGAALVINQNGRWTVWPPKILDATRAEIHNRRRYVFFRGDFADKVVLPAARELYWHLGGIEGRDRVSADVPRQGPVAGESLPVARVAAAPGV